MMENRISQADHATAALVGIAHELRSIARDDFGLNLLLDRVTWFHEALIILGVLTQRLEALARSEATHPVRLDMEGQGNGISKGN